MVPLCQPMPAPDTLTHATLTPTPSQDKKKDTLTLLVPQQKITARQKLGPTMAAPPKEMVSNTPPFLNCNRQKD